MSYDFMTDQEKKLRKLNVNLISPNFLSTVSDKFSFTFIWPFEINMCIIAIILLY